MCCGARWRSEDSYGVSSLHLIPVPGIELRSLDLHCSGSKNLSVPALISLHLSQGLTVAQDCHGAHQLVWMQSSCLRLHSAGFGATALVSSLACFLKQSPTMYPWLVWNLLCLCSSDSPQTQRSACLCLLSTGITGICHNTQHFMCSCVAAWMYC